MTSEQSYTSITKHQIISSEEVRFESAGFDTAVSDTGSPGVPGVILGLI